MKVSGKEVAAAILKKLEIEIKNKKLHPLLTIILAGDNPASRIYVNNKIKAAEKIGIKTKLFEFSKNQFNNCLGIIKKLNSDEKVHGIIIQYPVYKDWDFESLLRLINPKKDVDGFLPNSPFKGATALGVWEMLKNFSKIEGLKKIKDFLNNKKIVLLGKGKTAGGPTRKLLEDKNIKYTLIDSKTPNPLKIIKNADIIISTTGRKHIITGDKIKKGSYVIGVGVGKERIEKRENIFGDIEESTVSKKAKLYCPTIGGIGPLTIVSLLKNVTWASKKY